MEPQQQSGKERAHRLDNSELVKTSFWVSQIFMVVATIAGVYLAAKEGLSQAIAFDSLVSMQSNYHLRHSLHDEVSDNVVLLEQYITMVKTNQPPDLRQVHPQLADMVWQNMKYSGHTLETPSQILSAVRRFYLNVNQLLEQIEQRQLGRNLGLERIQQLCDQMKQQTLPLMQQDFQQLATTLDASGIKV